MTIEIIDSNLILSKVLRLSIFICSCRLLSLDNFISQVLRNRHGHIYYQFQIDSVRVREMQKHGSLEATLISHLPFALLLLHLCCHILASLAFRFTFAFTHVPLKAKRANVISRNIIV